MTAIVEALQNKPLAVELMIAALGSAVGVGIAILLS